MPLERHSFIMTAHFLRLCCVSSSLAFNNYNLLKNLW